MWLPIPIMPTGSPSTFHNVLPISPTTFPSSRFRIISHFLGLPRCKNLWIFLWFLAVTFLGSIVLTSQWLLGMNSLFYVTHEFHRFLHWGWVVLKTKHSKTKTEACSTQISKTKHPKLETTVGWRTATLSLAWCKPNQVEATDVSAPPEVHKSIPRFYFKPANWLTEHF